MGRLVRLTSPVAAPALLTPTVGLSAVGVVVDVRTGSLTIVLGTLLIALAGSTSAFAQGAATGAATGAVSGAKLAMWLLNCPVT